MRNDESAPTLFLRLEWLFLILAVVSLGAGLIAIPLLWASLFALASASIALVLASIRSARGRVMRASGDAAREARERPGFPGRLLGRPYPSGYLVAWFDRPEEADAAALELLKEGFDQVEILTGEEAVRLSDRFGDSAGPISRALRRFPSEEGSLEREYRSAAESGATLLAVPSRTEARTGTADEILVRHGAHGRHKYGRFTLKEMV